jgi:octaheme c-type cytochrome (tetrathionate reductase family)
MNVSSPTLLSCCVGLSGLLGLAGPAFAEQAPAGSHSTADHGRFEALSGPFEDGPEVTHACLECHTEAARQVKQSIHWTWEYRHPVTEQRLGKRHVVNNYCGSITMNWARCTSCHVGYGWRDADFDFSDGKRVDCLVCHDTTGDYVKLPTGAGHPPYQDTRFQGELIEAPDLAEVARNVGPSSRRTCGECHFKGGGGPGVKHGDLDDSLIDPPESLDVHMASEGLDYRCATCHEFEAHRQKGSRYQMTAKAEAGVALPGRPNERPACESCHGLAPHDGDFGNRLDTHADRIACQTCHIPTFARGGRATITWWDWSEAGRLDAEGEPVVIREDGHVVYHGKKGAFRWDENVVPDYRWFDGTVRYTLLDEPIDPAGVVALNPISGSADDPDSRLWPFKVMRGIQPYDAVNDVLVIEHLYGKEDSAFWRNFEWGPAIEAAMAEARRIGQTDVDYSGEYAFTETEMLWPLSHMIAPAEDSLACGDCHRTEGRLAGLAGFHLPGRDSFAGLDSAFTWLFWLSLAGVGLHGGARAGTALWRKRNPS